MGRSLQHYILCLSALAATITAVPPNAAQAEAPQARASAPADEDAAKFRDGVMRMVEAYRAGQYGTALAHCGQLLETMPAGISAKARMGFGMICLDLYSQNGRYREAMDLAASLRELQTTERAGELCFMEATTLTRMHKWDEARDKYLSCPQMSDQDMAAIAGNLAELSMIQEKPDEAADMYREAAAKFGDSPHVRFGLAVAMSRTGDWDGAARQFASGLIIDPGFTYLKGSFFEPKYEEDYETAVRMAWLSRGQEALFYLDRFLRQETRPSYRASAEQLSKMISEAADAGTQTPTASYPVLLDNVRTMAVDDSGSRLAFSNVARGDGDEIITSVWVADTGKGKADMVLALPTDIVTDMSFLPETGTLRILGARRRFEIDTASGATLSYDNNPSAFSVSLADTGKSILTITKDGTLGLAEWKDPFKVRELGKVPDSRTNRLRISHDHDTMLAASSLNTAMIRFDGGKDPAIAALTANIKLSALASHPAYDIYALGMQSGTMLVSEDGSMALAGSPNLAPVTAVAFSPEGGYMASMSGQSVEIWNVDGLVSKMVKIK